MVEVASPNTADLFAPASEETIEVMLSPVGKAPKLKVSKIKIKRSHTF